MNNNKRNALLLAFVTRQTVNITAMGQSGRVTVQGVINSLEHEDGSGVRFNVRLSSTLGSTTLFFDCDDYRHRVMLEHDN